MNKIALIGVFLLVSGSVTGAYWWFKQSQVKPVVPVYSEYSLLYSSWERYKTWFVSPEGRVIDHAAGGITTSEGQSYALLRAVFLGDKPTFDLVWQWTREHLNRSQDKLLSWKWGQRPDGTYGVMPEGGENSASDATVDSALALIFAHKRWGEPHYKSDALDLLDSLWHIETVTIANARYQIAGNWANQGDSVIINPSYFAPYAWRYFDEIDTRYEWSSLVAPAYQLLEKSSRDPLDATISASLPPNWIRLRESGLLEAASNEGLSTDYGFDAVRVPFRVALDYVWFDEPQALAYLAKLSYLEDYYAKHSMLPLSFGHDGQSLSHEENPVMYATALAAFKVTKFPLDSVVMRYSTKELYI